MPYSLIATALALASIAAAIPTLETRQDSGSRGSYIVDPWSGGAPAGESALTGTLNKLPAVDVLENGGLIMSIPTTTTNGGLETATAQPTDAGLVSRAAKRAARTLQTLEGRDPPDLHLIGKITGCPNKGFDPSLLDVRNKPPYAINQGVKVPKDGDDDECTTGAKTSKDRCWTEYYLVDRAVRYVNWRETGGVIDCRTTSTCSAQWADTNQTCTTTGSTLTPRTVQRIVDGTGAAELDLGLVKVQGQLKGGGTTTDGFKTTTTLNTVCNVSGQTLTCNWDDKACHQLYIADRVWHIWGQAQRVCRGEGDSKVVQQNTHDGNNRVIRGQEGFEFDLPINTLLGCGGMCSDSGTYPYPAPKDGDRRPFPKPATWA